MPDKLPYLHVRWGRLRVRAVGVPALLVFLVVALVFVCATRTPFSITVPDLAAMLSPK